MSPEPHKTPTIITSELESKWKLLNLRVDTFVKPFSLLTVVVAVIVAYFNIAYQQEQARQSRNRQENIEREALDAAKKSDLHCEDCQNLVLSLTPRLVAADTASPLLIVDIYLKNIGKVRVWPGKHEEGEGVELTVIEYEDYANTKSVKPTIIDWDHCGGNYTYLVEKYNVIGTYRAYERGTYTLHPGVEYHEVSVVPVKQGKLYAVRVRFFTEENGTTADFAYVHVPSVNAKVSDQ